MKDNQVIERWNPISLAEMAVGVKGVLYRQLHGKKRPFDFDDAIRHGIEFLEEASDGGAIICGDTLPKKFTGTLEPLTFTARYIDIDTKNLDESDFYRRVVETLREYKNVLETLGAGKKVEDPSSVKSTHEFFKIIANIAMQDADPISKTTSSPFS